jgi:prolyl-tRNA synthetase
VAPAAEGLYAALEAAGVATLFDDRQESAGVKLNDADLIGLPLRVTLGPRGLRQGEVEVRRRATGETETVPLAEAPARVAAATPGRSGREEGRA